LVLNRTVADSIQPKLFGREFPTQVEKFPQIRFMGNQYRLLPRIHSVLSGSAPTAVSSGPMPRNIY